MGPVIVQSFSFILNWKQLRSPELLGLLQNCSLTPWPNKASLECTCWHAIAPCRFNSGNWAGSLMHTQWASWARDRWALPLRWGLHHYSPDRAQGHSWWRWSVNHQKGHTSLLSCPSDSAACGSFLEKSLFSSPAMAELSNLTENCAQEAHKSVLEENHKSESSPCRLWLTSNSAWSQGHWL